MSEILKGSFLTDKNGQIMEVVDAEARAKAEQNAVPSTDQPNMQLVTNGNGEKVWEEKLAYDEIKEELLIDFASIVAKEINFNNKIWNMSEITEVKYPPHNTETYEVLKNIVGDGEHIRVVYDGVIYDFPNGFELDGEIEGVPSAYLGNRGLDRTGSGELLTPDKDNGMPFLLRFVYFSVIWYCEDGNPHAVYLYHCPSKVKPIDPKFIPEEVARHSELSPVATSGSWDNLEGKPFGEEIEVILPETVIATDGSESGGYQKVADSVNLVVGEEYIVVYNGEVNITKCKLWDYGTPTPYIGDISQMDWEQSSCFGHYALKGNGAMTLGAAAKAGDTIAVYKKSIVTLDSKFIPSTVPVIQSATVGQTVVVKAVDADGKPTEWEAADMSVGGGGTPYIYVSGQSVDKEKLIAAVKTGAPVLYAYSKADSTNLGDQYTRTVLLQPYSEYYVGPTLDDCGDFLMDGYCIEIKFAGTNEYGDRIEIFKSITEEEYRDIMSAWGVSVV